MVCYLIVLRLEKLLCYTEVLVVVGLSQRSVRHRFVIERVHEVK